MQPAKLNVFFAFFPYGGNGGVSSEHPSIRKWFARTILACHADPRVGDIKFDDFCDTPITMTRNAAVEAARQAGADVLIMCDSDQHPDRELGEDPLARPFWDTSFDFLYERKKKGLVTVVGAPYCGPPPNELVYVFRWTNQESNHPGADCHLEMYSRDHAAAMAGIQPVAALPTGLIMFDMSAFNLVGPEFFYYEYEDDGPQCQHCGQSAPGPRSRKASTEDVTATRDISLISLEGIGYSPIFANWDAWAGHYKPKCVRKPRPITVDAVGEKYRQAIRHGRRSDERLVTIRPGPMVEAVLRRQASDLTFAGDGWANGHADREADVSRP